jgi:hypothetical protein
MPRVSASSPTYRPSGGERVFADDQGRLWSAAHFGDALVFTCISDARQRGRAIAMDLETLDDSVGDETLRARLNAAPRIGTLS